MQSGISASSELHSAFKSLISSPSTRALLAGIEGEALVSRDTIQGTSDFYSDLKNVSSYLKSNEALYILIRAPNTSSDAPFTAVTYVPDSAPVRQKMLFAATRLTLTRELGSENFAETFFTTTAEELTPEGWKKHQAHTDADQPLTEEERNLVDIKEAEASEVGGTGRRGAGYGPSGGKKMDSDSGVVDALKELKAGDLVMLKIDQNERLVLADTGNPVVSRVAVGEISARIDSFEPRFSYYGHAHGDGQLAVIFMYTCPTMSKIRDRMIYASSRRSAEAICEQEAGVALAKKIEATDPSEITASAIEEEFAPKQEQKSNFAKPKRPGRR